MRVERFEDLLAWQKARALTRVVYARSRSFGNDYSLAAQMQRAAVSVMSNLAEGFDREGVAEFHRFVSIARGSCAELLSHAYVAYDVEYLSTADFEALAFSIREVSKLVRNLRASLQRAKK